jgi:hypothetical protein
MTENGILVPYETEKRPKYTLNYIDESLNSDLLLDYRELLHEEQAQVIKKTIEVFESSWSKFTLDTILYLRKENEMHFVLKNKTIILFTLQDFARKTGEEENYNHLRSQILSLKTFIENHEADLEK